MNQHKRIKDRPDKRRPLTISDIAKRPEFHAKDFVMDIKVLHRDGSSTRISWTEKRADKYALADIAGDKGE